MFFPKRQSFFIVLKPSGFTSPWQSKRACQKTILALFGIALFAVHARGENLIPDDLLDSSSGPDGGLPASLSASSNSTDGPNATVSVSDVAPASGKHSLCIERLNANANFWVHYDPKIPVQAGQRYYFSCQVKSTNGAPDVGFELFDANMKNLGITPLQDTIFANPNTEIRHNVISLRWCLADQPDGFNPLDIAFTVPDGVSYIRFNLSYNWTLGTAWFSNFKFLPLDRP
jgi:hypothetical protein